MKNSNNVSFINRRKILVTASSFGALRLLKPLEFFQINFLNSKNDIIDINRSVIFISNLGGYAITASNLLSLQHNYNYIRDYFSNGPKDYAFSEVNNIIKVCSINDGNKIPHANKLASLKNCANSKYVMHATPTQLNTEIITELKKLNFQFVYLITPDTEQQKKNYTAGILTNIWIHSDFEKNNNIEIDSKLIQKYHEQFDKVDVSLNNLMNQVPGHVVNLKSQYFNNITLLAEKLGLPAINKLQLSYLEKNLIKNANFSQNQFNLLLT